MKPTLQSLIGKRVHFIGIGGAGMSGLARISLSHSISVSGSDAKDSSVVKALQALGATIATMHEASNVDGADLVVYSTAISPNNPELKRAHELGLLTLTRAAALSILMSESKSIAVAGTHGKTTTSSMMAVALQSCGADPSFAIGGTITASGSNAHRGTGEIFVAEADESDGSFIEYHPYAAIITNIEHDHVDFFATPQDVAQAFEDFAATIKNEGFLTYCADDEGAKTLATTITACALVSYGTGAAVSYTHLTLPTSP
jgi:UDP-N-acetylmuramate--alanine ligase